MSPRQAPESSALLAAHQRLVRSGMTRKAAAARLLPQQSPESAARYLRKIRTSERTGKRIAHFPRVRKRIEILAPEQGRKLFPPHNIGDVIPRGKYSATLVFDTDRGYRASNVWLPRPNMSVNDIRKWSGYPQLVNLLEFKWSIVESYAANIKRLLDAFYHAAYSKVERPRLNLGTV